MSGCGRFANQTALPKGHKTKDLTPPNTATIYVTNPKPSGATFRKIVKLLDILNPLPKIDEPGLLPPNVTIKSVFMWNRRTLRLFAQTSAIKSSVGLPGSESWRTPRRAARSAKRLGVRAVLCRFSVATIGLLSFTAALTQAADTLRVGVASADITPDYPIRLNGYGFRRTESEGVTHPIFAKALAIADEQQGPALLITTDNLCVPDGITKTVAERLKKFGVKLERLTITATHTHTAPMLVDVAPTIFGTNIPPEHWQHIERYTREFTDKLVQVGESALKDIQPAQLSWGVGQAKFAMNRRTPGGPVDHDLSALFVRTPEGKVRAVYFSYPCHCTTFSFNKITGDWAGYAQDAVQKYFPSAIALVSVGCGADSNPNSRGSETNLTSCIQYGQEIGDEIKRLSENNTHPITVAPTIRYDRVDLPLDTPRTKEEWEERTHSSQYAVVYHAKLNLERLARGETLPTSLNYPIQTWLFGDQLAMLFLPGETVVDYSLRLKREYDRARLWVNGYSNDGRCYIPSERVLREGGYEGGDAMIYYDRPQRFAPGVEQRIFDIIYKQLPKSFSSVSRTEGVRPLSPQESLRAIHTKPGITVELVASEPLITDPVAIDWGADGRLWVCEMNDYPAGLDGNWQPGGRIKVLEDTNGDGIYDKATLFADNIPFPTGVTAWGKGVLICAAPDIIYAEDTNGDGKADKFQKMASGYFTDNFQARVNSLQLGLDNWIYGANGLLGGTIRAYPEYDANHVLSSQGPVDIRNHDFRFIPFTDRFETVTGVSQQGRARDDWGNWFGCDNSELLLHFGAPEHYFRRNPHITAPIGVVNLTSRPDGNRLYPRSRTLERFNDLDNANRTTSACGLAIYRDTLLGDQYYGNAFTCEVVHNLVHREILTNTDGTISSGRATDEQNSEFLASTDNWFRPAQVRTGPDGALYVVDMYRFLIEHPRWIPAARLAKIDVRAGSDMGRIYRLRPENKALRPVRDLTKLSPTELAADLDTPNGTERDRVHMELLTRKLSGAAPELAKLTRSASLPQVRLQALCALDGLSKATPEILVAAFHDSDRYVRQHALRIAEPLLIGRDKSIVAAVLSLTNDASTVVLQQLAFSLGESRDPRAGEALAALAVKAGDNAPIREAALSSANPHLVPLLDTLSALPPYTRGRSYWLQPLLSTATASSDPNAFVRAFTLATESKQPQAYAALLQELDRRKTTLTEFVTQNPSLQPFEGLYEQMLRSARVTATDTNMPPGLRENALSLFTRKLETPDDLAMLATLAARETTEPVRSTALNALRHQTGPAVAQSLLNLWSEASIEARMQIASLLLSRDEWANELLSAVRTRSIQPNEIAPAQRQIALHSSNEKIRDIANQLFVNHDRSSREQVVAKYKDVGTRNGSPANGAELFTQNCASCHKVAGIGHDVGPDLTTLRDKDADYWIKNILDPNAVIEPRFVAYNIALKDDRNLTGIIKSETPNSFLLVQGGGIHEKVNRADIESIHASQLSLMPEGLENAISPEQMPDLLAFLRKSEPAGRGAPELVLRDPASVARLILDDSQPNDLRETAISSNPQFAADLIREMTRDIDSSNEYNRIPWIWRVAVAAGKRNDTQQLKHILDVALPRNGAPMQDWKAVVIGGGLINGVSQRGLVPRERFAEIIGSDAELKERWDYSLKRATDMLSDKKIPDGTRYDLLRVLGAGDWAASGSSLKTFLASRNSELQMGAISALADIDSAGAVAALAARFWRLQKANQAIAEAALERTDEGRRALWEALENKHDTVDELPDEQ
jgi:putative membrane-bound dehydrogenase-like protein